MRRFVLVLISGLLVAFAGVGRASAQGGGFPEPPPLAAIVKDRVAGGVEPGGISAARISATQFTPGGKRVLLPELARKLGADTKQRDELLQLFESGMKAMEGEEKTPGKHDLAVALAFFTMAQCSVHRGVSAPSEATEKTLLAQFRTLLNVEAMRQASDADKQALYEWCVAASMVTVALKGQSNRSNDDKLTDSVRSLAGNFLTQLFGVAPERVSIVGKGLAITRSSGGTDKPTTGATGNLGRVSCTVPVGWKSDRAGNMTVLTLPQSDKEAEFRVAILPAVPASGSPQDEYRQLWQSVVLSGFDAEGKPLPFVRQLPNGNLVTFDGIPARRKGDRNGTARPVYLFVVRVGGASVPVVAQQMPLSSHPNSPEYFSITKSVPTEKEVAGILASISVGGQTSRPVSNIYDRSQFVGTWTVNVAAGTASYVTTSGYYAGDASSGYSGELVLRADGTFEETLNFLVTGKTLPPKSRYGRWSVDGDRIILKVERMEGRTNSPKEDSLRVIGIGPVGGETTFFTGEVSYLKPRDGIKFTRIK